MNDIENLEKFNHEQIAQLNDSVALAEDLVCNFYKMSASQWLKLKYDIKTLCDLSQEEVVFGPFAQIIRYEGKKNNLPLGSSTYDFYKICLQDHSILSTMKTTSELGFFPFSLYIIIHELIHVVRFCKFLQNFEASYEQKMVEEMRVHQRTHEILLPLNTPGLKEVLNYFEKWRISFDELR